MYFNMSSVKYWQVCLGLKVLKFYKEIFGEGDHLTLFFKMIHTGTAIFLNQSHTQFSQYELNIWHYTKYIQIPIYISGQNDIFSLWSFVIYFSYQATGI